MLSKGDISSSILEKNSLHHQVTIPGYNATKRSFCPVNKRRRAQH